MQFSPSYNKAIAAFDAANAQDPNYEIVEGQKHPRELLYAQRMSACLQEYHAEASEALALAARAQHICRWQIPRKNYPEGRSGYLRWRQELLQFHAKKAGEILSASGYDSKMQSRVQFLLSKKGLRMKGLRNRAKDLESAVLEDVVCLVFLSCYLPAFAKKHSQEKVLRILQKTWAKMSETAQAAARSMHAFPPETKAWLRTLELSFSSCKT